MKEKGDALVHVVKSGPGAIAAPVHSLKEDKPVKKRAMLTIQNLLGSFLCWLSADNGVCPCCLQDTGLPEACSGCGMALSFAEAEMGCSRCKDDGPLADSPESSSEPAPDSIRGQAPGIPPAMLSGGRCGCDRPRMSILPCGHCACGCECECGGCAANLIWKDEQESWCGCATPGYEVLSCGHCACGNGLCLELVKSGSVFEARRKVSCS